MWSHLWCSAASFLPECGGLFAAPQGEEGDNSTVAAPTLMVFEDWRGCCCNVLWAALSSRVLCSSCCAKLCSSGSFSSGWSRSGYGELLIPSGCSTLLPLITKGAAMTCIRASSFRGSSFWSTHSDGKLYVYRQLLKATPQTAAMQQHLQSLGWYAATQICWWVCKMLVCACSDWCVELERGWSLPSPWIRKGMQEYWV